MTREVLYERNMSGSYMKVPMALEGQLDEKILLRKKLPGLLPMEKVFVNQGGWYWYNISGKQSLDHYCRVKALELELFNRIISSLCREMEVMGQNYLSQDCLVLDSEYIFISNQTQEIVFMAYPGNTQSLNKGLQLLMEYLLTKIDHKDGAAVQRAYGIYEKTLDEGYTIAEIRDSMILSNQEEKHEEATEFYSEPKERETEILQQEVVQSEAVWKKTVVQEKFAELLEKLQEWKLNLKNKIPFQKETSKPQKRQNDIKSRSIVVTPEEWEEEEEKITETIHPTICLSDYREHPRGLLLYEGTENFSNILLNSFDQKIGKSKDASICIEKDTVSSLHAGISYEGQEYFLEDYNSTNGTYVNNELLAYKEKRQLKCNDIVRFADVKYRFV